MGPRFYDTLHHVSLGERSAFECTACKQVNNNWEDSDLDVSGRLQHQCPAVNWWGTLMAELDDTDGYCMHCERENFRHYEICPVHPPRT